MMMMDARAVRASELTAAYLEREEEAYRRLGAVETVTVTRWEKDLLEMVRRGGRADARTLARVEALTPRQRDIFALMVRGACDKDIAKELGIGLSHTKRYASTILALLGVENRTAACALYHGTLPYSPQGTAGAARQ